ncbi:hypothetical protein LTS08_007069 [Lithohypha guttulata]|nr:hypothetical protein LTS08_007069 [Lithohypha guttulata]
MAESEVDDSGIAPATTHDLVAGVENSGDMPFLPLNDLAVIIAAIELVTRCILALHYSQGRCSRSINFSEWKKSFSILEQHFALKFNHAVEHAKMQIGSMPQSDQRLFRLRLAALEETYRLVCQNLHFFESDTWTPQHGRQAWSASNWVGVDIGQFTEVRLLSCTSKVCLGVQSGDVQTWTAMGRVCDREDYLDLEFNLSTLFASDLSSSSHKDVFINGFPAAHIAYWNLQKDMAVELWDIAAHGRDILNRTFLHIVVESIDHVTLHKALTTRDDALKAKTEVDARGLSVLDVSFMREWDFGIPHLLDLGAYSANPAGLMTRAVRMNRVAQVRHLLSYKHICPCGPWIHHISAAITQQHEGVVHAFLEDPYFSDEVPSNDRAELVRKARLHLPHLATHIDVLPGIDASPADAEMSLNVIPSPYLEHVAQITQDNLPYHHNEDPGLPALMNNLHFPGSSIPTDWSYAMALPNLDSTIQIAQEYLPDFSRHNPFTGPG